MHCTHDSLYTNEELFISYSYVKIHNIMIHLTNFKKKGCDIHHNELVIKPEILKEQKGLLLNEAKIRV